MLLPGMLYFLVYKYLPMYGAVIAFKDFSINDGILGSSWANPWYKHFKYFYDSPYFAQVMTNTLLISIYKLFWLMPTSILLAILLSEIRWKPFRNIVQSILYMPHFISWVIILGISLALFSEADGLINTMLKDWGLHSFPFLTSNEWIRSLLVGSDLWQNMGWGAIVYLAAIAGIDPTLYEAARVDGAGRLRMIWHITLPGIRNVIVLMLILRMGTILDAGFEQIYVMYNIQVYEKADIIDTWVFRTGLEQFNFSLGAAVGLYKSIIALTLVVTANAIAKRWGESIW
ncbi:ABC transporter permease subunit [Paenibacillus roseipurpureus]|uniref:ABC transporter permease subunit n=2 Tax=Paenibacillus roseopurpureus TaxID=2918901 RepID=A0AA96LTQ8_9BACL|nr:ABC transporter permease subunit [Paenibacillus sp. MBLB1832]WNR46992.1 ABC transporter permease subunit [Paenibacillus sp. MBLB1832]